MKIPEAAQQQHVAVLGKTGSGKTFAIKGIVEHWLESRQRVGIVDPTGAWWGLRSSKDGKGAGFPILVLGGDHGDLPLPALGGAAVAHLLAEQGVNLVADTTLLTVGERTRWFTDFASTLYRSNKGPLHLVIDEAHNFAPQGKVPDPDTGKMLHAANSLASGGRSRGIRLAMITQRPQKLHKDTLTSADTLIAMRVLAPHDRDAVKAWIDGCGDPAQGKEVLGSLANMQRGEGWVWYPEGGFLERMKFPPIKTFDSSATPTDGGTLKAPKGAAEIDLTEIRAALADAVKEAEANDPKLLRAKIRELEKQLAGKEVLEKIIEVPVLKNGQLERTEKIADRLQQFTDKFLSETQELRRLIAPAATPRPAPRPAVMTRPVMARPAPAPRQPRAEPVEGVSRSQQRILDSLAALEGMGIAQPSKEQLALWCEVSPTSGGYFNNLGALRSLGLIEYPSSGVVALTPEGRNVAQPSEPLTVEQMQDSLYRKVGASKAAILKALVEIYPEPIAKDELAERIGVSPTSGGYFNNLGSLRTLGVIDYPAPGAVAALPVLFLE
jgi:hypothetical protein